ncbi:MAG: curli assembly protein CsgG [Nitrospinae bacterium]|nr:curli assembly protein CsgG [Nitrospinota bacterium]
MNRIYFIIGFSAAFISGCSTIDVATSRKANITKEMNKIIVFPFDIKGANWGDEFSEAVTHYLFKTGKIEVVERDALKKVLLEQQLSMTGIIDENKAVKVGRLLGADVIVIGKGTALIKQGKKGEEKNLIDTFSLKAISIETGSVLLTVRKEPGAAWDWKHRAKYIGSFGLIWDKDDIMSESSKYDEVARQIASNILETIKEIEKKNNPSSGKK